MLSFERPHSPKLNEIYNFEIEIDDRTISLHISPTKQQSLGILLSSSNLGLRKF